MAQNAALAIYQDFLDLMGAAVIASDADTFLAHVFLPHRIVTETETIVIETMASSRRHFEGFAAALRGQGADSYARVAKTAVFLSPDRIAGTHDAFISSRGKLVVPRFANEIEIVQRDGIWGSVRTRHYTRFVSWPDILPRMTV
ncbi:hypothetical protein roselon_03625 [Roseibacterium elongatum DSM 19469]|uniref:SnoaL-like domain-containing protein n=1 Tax=Roseicyclus elongatus DSM 19469 TaxID=1294273 RepID=W8RXD3_9RHOB|nr:hypothetical protein [Roseibacterium elongatum]AHM05869.1 hypothetical protein roselon_03625 [Roseibacterium elongatum DSM 19469]